MHAAALWTLLCGVLPAQSTELDNLDFRTGTLAGWRGHGFYVTSGNPRGPSVSLGVCSSDRGKPGRTGSRRYTFVVPPGAGQLRCSAYAVCGRNYSPDDRLDVLLVSADNAVIPKMVFGADGWRSVDSLLPREGGKAREYCWDIATYVGRTVQIVLRDNDIRPGCHLYCSGFRLTRGGELDAQQFAADVRRMERESKVPPLVRFDTKNFMAWSNADERFSKTRLRNCELMYGLFFDHFARRGFSVHPPASKMMVAIFDSQDGFEAYLGHKMPSAVTGLYNRLNNRLVIYDLTNNNAIAAGKQKALEAGRNLRLDLDRIRHIETVQRLVNDQSQDGSLSTAMHETAHQLSFNCGLLNRMGDVPLWLGEGLACYCEATDQGGWQGMGEVNPMRVSVLAAVIDGKGKFMPLTTLVSTDAWLQHSSASAIVGYSQSWALFRLLMQERPEAMRKYLALIRARQTTDHRLTDFGEVFGPDLAPLERRYTEYMHDLARRHTLRAAR